MSHEEVLKIIKKPLAKSLHTTNLNVAQTNHETIIRTGITYKKSPLEKSVEFVPYGFEVERDSL